jgi:SAM-dependent methyltransferase
MAIHEHLQVLSEPLRTRILRVLEEDEVGISVGELARVLSSPQSTVSRHLKVLDQAGWLTRNASGPSSLLRLDRGALPEALASLWAVVRAEAEADDLFAADLRRLEAILALRRDDPTQFFGHVAGRWDDVRRTLYGTRFQLPSLLGLLSPSLDVADLGCGTGETVAALSPHVRKVIGVDREGAMLDRARARVESIDNVDLRHGDLTDLPLRAHEVDAALATLVLHLVPDAEAAFREIGRVLVKKGTAVVTDLQPHAHDELRATMGHAHLGFGEDDLRRLARVGGLKLVRYQPLAAEDEVVGPPLFVAVFRA